VEASEHNAKERLLMIPETEYEKHWQHQWHKCAPAAAAAYLKVV
jgi:hypothetical protein